MSKIKRYYEKNAVYFITTNTYARRELFKKERTALFLMNTIAFYKHVFSFSLYGFCIMPDHLHMIIQPHLQKYNSSLILQYLKGAFAINYNKLIRKNGPVWQKRFYDEVIKTERDILIKINYILQNPVRKRIVEKAEDYPYSSAAPYINGVKDRMTDVYNQII